MNRLRKIINKYKNKSLSNHDLVKLLDGKANILTYTQLNDYDNIEEAMGPYNALILLYLTKHNYGHWVSVFKENNHTIEFFDPYGLLPDSELKFSSEYFRQKSGEIKPHLTYLLYKSGYDINYNNYRLQKKKNDVSTCGRHAAFRLILRDMPLEDYVKLLKSFRPLNPDDVVTLFTIFI